MYTTEQLAVIDEISKKLETTSYIMPNGFTEMRTDIKRLLEILHSKPTLKSSAQWERYAELLTQKAAPLLSAALNTVDQHALATLGALELSTQCVQALAVELRQKGQ